MTRLKSEDVIVAQYASVFFLAFVTRAQYDKLMLLVAEIDDEVDFKSIDGASKRKKTFKNQAIKSTFPLTAKLFKAIDSLDMLDDNFRTPETHKMGRTLGLILSGHYRTLYNEVFAFFNQGNQIFKEICEHLKNSKNSGCG